MEELDNEDTAGDDTELAQDKMMAVSKAAPMGTMKIRAFNSKPRRTKV